MSGSSPMFGFTGEQQDFGNNLVYLRARYYNPALGRFLTPDSLIPDVTNGQSLNAYAYVYNDPINLVDPSGNIPTVGDTVVWGALHAPDSWKSGIRDFAGRRIESIDNWYSKPDDCSCRSGSPAFITDLTGSINRNVANPAGQLALAAWTYPAQKVAARVDVYGRWPTSTSMGRISVDRLSHSYRNVDVTNMKLMNYGSSSSYRNGGGQMSRVLRMNDGRKVVIHNAETRMTPGGLRGVEASVIGSGLIDGAFQAYDDWAQGLCLSPNQRFWRAYGAMFAGFAAGAIGTLAVGLLVAAGAPAIVAAIGGFVVSSYVGYKLAPYKNDFVNLLGDAAGRW